MNSLNLRSYYGKKIKMYFKDRRTLIGFVDGIDDAESNENGMESMTIVDTDIAEFVDVNEEELERIEIIEE